MYMYHKWFVLRVAGLDSSNITATSLFVFATPGFDKLDYHF